jgi:hypothetical protein
VSSVKSFDAGEGGRKMTDHLYTTTDRAEIAHHTQGLVNIGGEEGAYTEDDGVEGYGEWQAGEGEAGPSEHREGSKGMETT